ncbi:MAG: glycosyltransferase family 39 protein [Bacteroidales bacterium]|jgi:hypothetical protein
MEIKKADYTRYMVILMVVSALVRGFFAFAVELGNDEVYYRLYAMYPDWSHFDHPLMVGWVIQFFSLNLLFTNELFLRMGSIVFGTMNLWLMFQIGKTLRDERTGFIAALLYTSSVYGFVITGIFLLPDTPQGLFWIWALYLMIKTLPGCPRLYENRANMIQLGLVLGLAILSKYTSVFLWGGLVLYLLIFNRKWFSSKYLYIALMASVLIALPILIWNLQNNFISFTWQGERVNVAGHGLRADYFLTELLGELLYNNPINFVLIVLAVVGFFRGKMTIEKKQARVILLLSLPLIGTFLAFSLFRSTLPHWTAPGYTTLIPLTAVWLTERPSTRLIPNSVSAALGLLLLVLLLGFAQIKTGLFPLDTTTTFEKIGEDDPSLDMFGYKEAGRDFQKIVQRDQAHDQMNKSTFLVGTNWFPLANYDYYAATPAGLKTFAIGSLGRIHKYAWINQIEGGFKLGSDAYYITDSRDYKAPDSTLCNYFETVIPADTIQMSRGGKVAKRVFVFKMKNLIRIPNDPLKN